MLPPKKQKQQRNLFWHASWIARRAYQYWHCAERSFAARNKEDPTFAFWLTVNLSFNYFQARSTTCVPDFRVIFFVIGFLFHELHIGDLPLPLALDPLLPMDQHPRHLGLVALGRVSVQDHLLVLQPLLCQRSPLDSLGHSLLKTSVSGWPRWTMTHFSQTGGFVGPLGNAVSTSTRGNCTLFSWMALSLFRRRAKAAHCSRGLL